MKNNSYWHEESGPFYKFKLFGVSFDFSHRIEESSSFY